jgi:hypothetical protein
MALMRVKKKRDVEDIEGTFFDDPLIERAYRAPARRARFAPSTHLILRCALGCAPRCACVALHRHRP